jgi:hypothetical protein
LARSGASQVVKFVEGDTKRFNCAGSAIGNH